MSETVPREIGSEDLLDVAKDMLEAIAQNLEELDEFSTEEIDVALAAAEWEADSSLRGLPPLGQKPSQGEGHG